MSVSNSDTIGRGAAAICQGTGGAAEVLRDARGPPGPLCTVMAGAAAGVSCAHGCRLGYELRRTPSADSPAVGKGGPLGPGYLLPAAAKPGGAPERGGCQETRQGGGAAAGRLWPSRGRQSREDAGIPSGAAEPLSAHRARRRPSWAV